MNFLHALEAISPESLMEVVERIPAPGTDPTLDSYPVLLEFVSRAAAVRDQVSLTGIAHTIYGWMPTMLAFDDSVVIPDFWANTEAGSLDLAFLETLKKAVNNSIVGASKVLHFLNPEAYAIWDSRVFRGITSIPVVHDFQVNRIDRFVEYTNWIREFSKGDGVKKLKGEMVGRGLLNSETSSLRAVELCLFCMGKVTLAATVLRPEQLTSDAGEPDATLAEHLRLPVFRRAQNQHLEGLGCQSLETGNDPAQVSKGSRNSHR